MRDLVCFAHGRSGDWEGHCLDFDIAVQGRSFIEVQESLEEAIGQYVAAARDEDDETRSRLLNRRAPLRVSIAWTLRVLWSAWRNGAHDETSAQFPIACPA